MVSSWWDTNNWHANDEYPFLAVNYKREKESSYSTKATPEKT